MWLHLKLISEVASTCKDIFKNGSVSYAYTTIPTYPRYILLINDILLLT